MAAPGTQDIMTAARQIIDNGMPPQQVADIVFNAIREEKFYILPDAEIYKPMIQARMEDILQERNPRPVVPFELK